MHDTIRFLLDDEVVSIRNCDPTRTVLQFLREDRQRLGTKEGCAEGDCGACTVVVVTPDEDGTALRYQAVNSCIQFLPTLDGKELITVESLVGSNGALHPVQQAMVECHGSQCGFCTPGFVMSLFALYKQQPSAERGQIDRALAGNLCRCTGYRPIIDAATRMYALGQAIPASEHERLTRPGGSRPRDVGAEAAKPPGDDQQVIGQLRSLSRTDTLQVTHGERQYFAPVTLTELTKLVALHPDATVLAGGTDVGLWVTKHYRDLQTVIYIGGVDELRHIAISDSVIEIGAAVTITDAMPVLLDTFPDLREMFVRFAAPPIRNAGTLGGNVANGSPIGDSMPALLALDTQVILRHKECRREIPLADFYLGYMVNAMQPGEIVERLCIPLPVAGQIIRCYKVSKRFDEDISALCMAFSMTLDGDNVATIRIACGGLSAIPTRATVCEQVLTGKAWNDKTVTDGMAALEREFAPISDLRATAAYRRTVMKNLLLRFFIESTDTGETTRVYDYAL